MKNKIRIALLLISLAAVVLLAVACGSPEGISVGEDAMPRLTYVRGQELDLSGGVLVVDNGKKVKEIPLDSEDVTVSGYDKDKLGEQTLTVEYDGVTTEIKVTVVERIAVIGAVTDYLVGDKIDKTKGRLVITNDDGTTRSLQMASDAVTLSGFDSLNEGMGRDVKIVCRIGGDSYEGSYKVNIYPVENVDFNRPNKVTYNSHYSKSLDLSGGSIVLSGKNGELERTVSLSECKVSGFDISAVTPENSPLSQEISIIYDGRAYTYDIKITYTSVSMFIDNADKLSSIDWTGGEPQIDASLGELALKLCEAYIDMSEADRKIINENLAYNVARAAMVYGFGLWADNINEFRGAFAIELSELVLYCESYEACVRAVELFDDKSTPIYTVAPTLLGIIELFGDRIVYTDTDGDVYFKNYPVMDESYLSVLRSLFAHLTDVYKTLSVVPDGWTADSLDNYSAEIQSAYLKMVQAGYEQAFDEIYYFVSPWRKNNDLFDILYTYLYKIGRTDFVEYFYEYGMPKAIDDLNAKLISTMSSMKLADSTNFFYYYMAATDLAEMIKLDTESVENYIYRTMPVNTIWGYTGEKVYFEDMLVYVRMAEYGYYDLSGSLLGIPDYESLMSKYLTLIDNINNNEDYMSTEAYKSEVKVIFDAFVALPASQQYDFISALAPLYPQGIPAFAFDDSQENIDKGLIGLFAGIINSAMRSTLSAESASVYNDLILSVEIYANRFGYPEWESDFVARIDRITQALTAMSESDLASFEIYLSSAYEKYLAIREGLKSPSSTEIGAWADKFAALGSALTDAQTACYYFTTDGKINYTYFFSSFERAMSISEDILKNAPNDIVAAYYGEALFLAYPEDSEAGKPAVYWSYDFALSSYRATYIDLFILLSDSVDMYALYNKKEIGSFLDLYYGMISPFLHKSEGESKVFDKATVLSVMEAYRLLDTDSKSIFGILEADVDMYHGALELFINETFTAAAADVAVKLYTLERYCYSYEVVASDVTLNQIRSLLSELKAAYSALEGEDKASFLDLEQVYEYYVEKCENIA
ncbi:MAG: hypothetical protein E7617_01000 [Ruminococcaceae bacterium]|nr:hypothetical protein [Oscillospiraceae bacterium]